MAALPAFRLNMIAKVIDGTTGNEIVQKEWSNVFTDNTPVTVLFDDRTYFIAVGGKVIYNQDVLATVSVSFQDYVHTVKEIRAVRNLEKELRKKLAGFHYKPKTLGDLLKQQLAQQVAPVQVDLSALVVGDVVKLLNGNYVYVATIEQLDPSNIYEFSINNIKYKHNGAYYATGVGVQDIVQIIKKGAKLLSNAWPGDLVLSECQHTPWVIKSIKKLQKQDDVYAVYFEGGEMDLYKDNGTSYNNTSSIVLL